MSNSLLVMKQSKFNADASYFTYINTGDHQRGDCILLSCLLQSLCPVRLVSRNVTKRFTVPRPGETIRCLPE